MLNRRSLLVGMSATVVSCTAPEPVLAVASELSVEQQFDRLVAELQQLAMRMNGGAETWEVVANRTDSVFLVTAMRRIGGEYA